MLKINKSTILVCAILIAIGTSCSKQNKQVVEESNKVVAQTVTNKLSGLAPTPPMGWNSWNWYGKQDINEKAVMGTIDAMASNGLRDAGYKYVIVDGGWRDTILGPKGELLVHKTKFPRGMKFLADYAHAKGMKFGLHVVPGTHDCGGDEVGAYNKEEVHLKQFVDWELDFIKLDLCRYNLDPCEPCTPYRNSWTEETIEDVYKKWSGLLANCGRDITFSISAYTFRDWYPETCNMARTTGDIESRIHNGAYFNRDTKKHSHLSVLDIAEVNNHYADKAGNGYWNDPDMMVTGENGLNETEQTSHFALWCMMSSPLFMGSDPITIGDFEKQLLMNKEMVAINQDPLEQGRIVKRDGISQVWHKKLKDGKSALLFLSLKGGKLKGISFDLRKIGFDKNAKIRDVINHKDLNINRDVISFQLKKHESKMLVLSK
ncbi:glycoside hydrolase family 27 protein [Flavivirga amylovorans]|uniref:Alpha-galactosidase n=1 Tax=Flavivirga amylovorans TaxID=870486 RepID=A0ABT8WWV4_9FLAO|nr:glycoside hydrolase family 27 protein [Flavivirga amylovorans]MDO5986161.1 glycoside hydrolase family 27 protein [Flavivirga amylovorans]